MCFTNIRIGISMFLFYSILVPYINIFSLGENLFTLIIAISVLYNYNLKTLIFKPIGPFIFLYIAQFAIIPFHNKVPYSLQFNLFRADFMRIILLPFAMFNVVYRDPKAFHLFYKTLVFSIIIVVAYSLSLTIMHGVNPYLMTILPLSGREFDASGALVGDRAFGRISGVFPHPMTNGFFLSISLMFALSKINFQSVSQNKLNIASFIVISITILFIGVRTAIGAIVVGMGIYFLIERKIKPIFWGLFLILILNIIVKTIPGLEQYVSSIIDPSSSSIEGSSIQMRTEQLLGSFNEIKNNFFFGNGYGWTGYYLQSNEMHPVMIAFESILIMILCNNGFAGIIIWVFTIILYLKLIGQNFSRHSRAILIALLATYLSYSFITGEYGYMKYFLIFYTIIWVDGRNSIYECYPRRL